MESLKKITTASLLAFLGILASQHFSVAADVFSDHGQDTIYVAPFGDNDNHGTKHAPLKTIGYAVEKIKSGQFLLIADGVYRETVNIARSGTPDNPIIIKGRDQGNVIVTGTELIAGKWEDYGEGIYRIKTDFVFNQLFWEGRMLQEARWPNSSWEDVFDVKYAVAEKGTAHHTLVDTNLPAGDYNGARCWYRNIKQSRNRVFAIHNYKPGESFDFDPVVPSMGNTTGFDEDLQRPMEGVQYHLQGSLDALDTAGEWYLDKAQKWLYLKLPDDRSPTEEPITVKVRDTAFSIVDVSNIRVENIRVFASNIFIDSADFIDINNCHMRYVNHTDHDIDGFHFIQLNRMVGNNNTWRNSSIVYAGASALVVSGEKNKVTNSIIHEANYHGSFAAALRAPAVDTEISYNTIYNAGRDLIYHNRAVDIKILYNDLYTNNLLVRDAGATKAWGSSGGASEIAYNWIHDCNQQYANGIYMDNYNAGYKIHHNVIWNISDSAIRLNSPCNDVIVSNNTIIDCKYATRSYTYKGEIPNQKGTVWVNNLIVDKGESTWGNFESGEEAGISSFVQGEFGATVLSNGTGNVDSNFFPVEGSEIIDAGEVVLGITDGYIGEAPDLGAYEHGGERWIPGAKWKDVAFVDY